MTTELPKSFDPAAARQKCLALWDAAGDFVADPDAGGEAYSIVIPPPNVTGALHMGHALNGTLQDVLVRFHRMRGFNTLWVPGTDHAGIATQAVVERLVWNTEKKTRRDLGRDELVSRIWSWKDRYAARILGQLKELGASCDWSRTAFTLDAKCSAAVREAFLRLFRDGYIYRGKRLVNWDTQLQTSVADDETYTEETKGGFWTCHYKVVDSPSGEVIRFSTTRPETMLGDTAVCVHPGDERYRHLVGKRVVQPHTGREIPVIADALLADPTLGTGCVKVTPAHDPNDYACWQRNPAIGVINILNPDGTIADGFGAYSGLKRAEAREAVIARMEELGQFEGREDRVIPLKCSDRSKTAIEPYLSDQWFVQMADRDDGKPGLAQTAIDAVASGKVRFTPERYAKTYTEWLGEKRDWCVSRQLWWGHRIPVWTTAAPEPAVSAAFAGDSRVAWQVGADGLVRVCASFDLAEGAVPGHTLTQDGDVLDTWFSSALWPFSTLGWPERTADLERYYPTSTLVTSRDIITLWVARMVMMGQYCLGDVPFREVYITPKLLDGFGEGMSKTRGNGVDPLDILDISGADALRYYVTAISGDTQDSRLPVANQCPHCKALTPLKRENTQADETKRPKKITCPECKSTFRPGGPWTADDPTMPTAKQASEAFDQGRNFANKLWNAARYLVGNLGGYEPRALTHAELALEDRWILSRLAATTEEVTAALERYRFAEVARLVYDFAWSEFCDWAIEMSKARLRDPATKAASLTVLISVLDAVARLAHPVMPFVTETVWGALNDALPRRGLFAVGVAAPRASVARWPSPHPEWRDAATEQSVARMQSLVRGVREVRNRYMLDRTPLDLVVRCAAGVAADFAALAPFIRSLGGVAAFDCGPGAVKPPLAASILHSDFEAFVPLAGLIDPAAEAARTRKQIADAEKQIAGSAGRLANASYVANAPPEVVEETRAKVRELEGQVGVLRASLAEFEAG